LNPDLIQIRIRNTGKSCLSIFFPVADAGERFSSHLDHTPPPLPRYNGCFIFKRTVNFYKFFASNTNSIQYSRSIKRKGASTPSKVFLYYALLHLSDFRFYCVGGCWDRTQDYYDFVTVRRSNQSSRSHPPLGSISSTTSAKSHPPLG